ncbi:MAG: hypothetical protein ACLFPQ_03435 [Candidatus Woesearchaeota archaeon]
MKTFLLSLFAVLLVSAVMADSGIERIMPAQAERCSNVEIEIIVSVDEDTFYAIDEEIPSGWDIDDPGLADETQENHLKWLVLSGAEDINYKYRLNAPCNNFGIHEFNGKYMFGSDSESSTLFGTIEIVPEDCSYSKCIGEDPLKGIDPVVWE